VKIAYIHVKSCFHELFHIENCMGQHLCQEMNVLKKMMVGSLLLFTMKNTLFL